MRKFAVLFAAAAFMALPSVQSEAGLFDWLHGGDDCCCVVDTCCPVQPTCCVPSHYAAAPVYHAAPSCCAPAPTCCAPAPSCAAPIYGHGAGYAAPHALPTPAGPPPIQEGGPVEEAPMPPPEAE